jgi:hypothetical protein
MAQVMKISAVAPAGFWRAGRFWPQAGELVDPATLEPGVLERLRAEPNLRVEPVAAGSAEAPAPADLESRVRAAIAALPAEAFGAAGAPNLAPLRAALGEDGRHLTAALRDRVWAELSARPPG